MGQVMDLCAGARNEPAAAAAAAPTDASGNASNVVGLNDQKDPGAAGTPQKDAGPVIEKKWT